MDASPISSSARVADQDSAELYKPRTTDYASDYLGVAVLTLEGWRRESRKRRRLVGPAWINVAVDDGKEIPRYRLVDLITWLDSRKTPFSPARRPGRPRKIEAVTAAGTL